MARRKATKNERIDPLMNEITEIIRSRLSDAIGAAYADTITEEIDRIADEVVLDLVNELVEIYIDELTLPF